MKKIIMVLSLITLIFSGCAITNTNKDEKEVQNNLEMSKVTEVKVEEAKELLEKDEDIVVLDVRTQEEYDAGHLKNAILIPYDEIDKRIEEIKQYKDSPVLVYCRTGRRSSIAVDALLKNEFSKVYHMHQGISQWKYDVTKS